MKKIHYRIIKYLIRSKKFIKSKLHKYKDICACYSYLLKRKKSYEVPKNKLNEYHLDSGKIVKGDDFDFPNATVDLTIIIPMYNVSLYIQECLDSIIKQEISYTCEILLMDDGSSDDTLKKIEPYLLDTRITLETQKNAGQSVARNKLINRAKGKYIMFLDADDILFDNSINALLDTAYKNDSDIVEGKIKEYSYCIPNIQQGFKNLNVYYKSNEDMPEFVLTCSGFSVAKIYNRKLWKTLRFPEGYIFEDIITKFILRRKANKVAFIDYYVYGYRYNPNSSTNNRNNLKLLDSIWVLPTMRELCIQENVQVDGIFYLLALHHIAFLNFDTLSDKMSEIKSAAFYEMRRQLLSILEIRPRKMPIMYYVLEKAILNGDIIMWEKVVSCIKKYKLLTKWREVS